MPRIIISEEGKNSQPYKIKLTNKIVKIGRSPSCNIVLEDVNASSHHCTIQRVPGGLVAIDENSTNGLIYEKQRYKYVDLIQDTEFFLGDVKVNILFIDDEYDVLSEENFESVQISLNDFQLEQQEIEIEEEIELIETNPSSALKQQAPANPLQTAQPSLAKPAPVLATGGVAPIAGARPNPYVQKKSNNTPLFLLLSVVAIIGGFSLKHYQNTDGEFLLSNLFGKKIEVKSETNETINTSAKE